MTKKKKDPNAVALGAKGGRARARSLTTEERREIARLGAAAKHRKWLEEQAARAAKKS